MASIGEKILDDFVYQPIGKAQIEIVGCRNITRLPQNSQIFIQIVHKPLEYKTVSLVGRTNTQWNQKYIIPLSNHYFSIVFRLVVIKNGGWFTDQ